MGVRERQVLHNPIPADYDIMKFEQVLKRIKSDTWWSEESPCNYQQAIPAWRAFILQSKTWGPRFLTIVIALYKNDFLFEKTSEQEKLTQFEKALDNPGLVKKDYSEFLKAKKELIVAGDKLLKALKKDDKVFAKDYKDFYDTYTRMFTHSVVPESADVYSERELKQDPETNVILSTYPMLSFMEQERLDFLTMILSNKIDFKKFVEKYHWIQNNYLGARLLDEKYFRHAYIELRHEKTKKELLKELSSLKTKVFRLKFKQSQLLKKLKLPTKTVKAFELLRFFSRWIDERKWAALHAIYYIDIFLKEVSRRTKIPKDQLGYYTLEEMLDLLINKKEIKPSEVFERRKLSVYIYARENNKYQELILTGSQAKKVFELYSQKTSNVFSGQVANAPIANYRGKVQVILNPHTEKFTAGKILVTTMTRPDFVPLMRKAAAIITDEGGITSHAAIVSRELGIPCIIGTKIATKALKTGDTVEIDIVKGIVRKV